MKEFSNLTLQKGKDRSNLASRKRFELLLPG
jgi:hypothetical protein